MGISIKVLGCKHCKAVLIEKWSKEKEKENWVCKDCAKKDCAPYKLITKRKQWKKRR